MSVNHYNHLIQLLKSRGVTLKDITQLVYDLQKPYASDITMEKALLSIQSVLNKREVQHALLTGIELDVLAEQHKLSEPLESYLLNDESLYGCDEVLTFSITNLYGSICFTNYGYLDKTKPGILEWLNDTSTGKVNVFLDDLIAAVAAAAASRIAHRIYEKEES